MRRMPHESSYYLMCSSLRARFPRAELSASPLRLMQDFKCFLLPACVTAHLLISLGLRLVRQWDYFAADVPSYAGWRTLIVIQNTLSCL